MAATAEEISASSDSLRDAIVHLGEKAQDGSREAKEIEQRALELKTQANAALSRATDIYFEEESSLKKAIEESKVVQNIVNLTQGITSISEQTDVLALNAAIEAARAGSYGKGFAIVAEEIRKLAEQSSLTARNIEQVVLVHQNLASGAINVLAFINDVVRPDYDKFVDTGKNYEKDSSRHLGTLELPKSDWPKLAKILEARLAGQNSLFEDETQMATAADRAMDYYSFVQMKDEEKSARKQKQTLCVIDLESVEHTMSRSLGPELVAHAFWERLGFDKLLQTCGLSPSERSLAQAIVLGRLIQPSERQTGFWLKKKTSLLEMLAVDLSEIGKNALYEIGDTLLIHKKRLEQELRKQEEALFPQEHALFLYDLTNTYFEGAASKNTSAKRGHSKEKRNDCPLVTLALVVDNRGFPIFSQIYKGNKSEPETLEEILKRLYVEDETLYNETFPTIVMDRGIATKNNIELLKQKHYPYIVVERRATEKDYTQEFTTAKETFDKMEDDSKEDSSTVYVKKILTEDACRVLCWSEGREQKEQVVDTLKEKRFLEDLERLKASVSKKGILLTTKVAERVGRIKERYPSMAKYYDISLELDEEKKKVVSLS